MRLTLPTTRLPRVLLFQPSVQGGEVLQQGRGIHVVAAGEFFQGLLPRLAIAFLQHRPVFVAGGFAAVETAFGQWAYVAGRIA